MGENQIRLFFNGKIQPYVCMYAYAWDAFLIAVCHVSEREEFYNNIFYFIFLGSISLTYISVFIYDEHYCFLSLSIL